VRAGAVVWPIVGSWRHEGEAARSDPGILPSSSFRLELDQLQIHHHRPLRLVGWLVRNESSRWRGLMRTAAFGFLPA
jgi:hypothetical protein